MRYDRPNEPNGAAVVTILVVLISSLALVGIVFFFVRGTRAAPGEPSEYPFEARVPLNDRERELYWRLREMMPEGIVLSQVGLSRILRVRAGYDFRVWFKRINRMTIHFLVCRADSTIVAAIELDDAAHGEAEREVADQRKAKALESAGIRLLRFREMPTERELREALAPGEAPSAG
jgi:very-short-patch-repair endonuclease